MLRTSIWILPAVVIVGGLSVALGGGALDLAMRHLDAEGDCAPVGPPPTVSDPDRVAALADAVWEDPQRMDCILRREGLDRRHFVELVDQVSASPTQGPLYQAARKIRSGL